MDIRKIAVISLSSKDYRSFDHKLAEAVKWVEHAAVMGAQLAVLPETLNKYCGDGHGNSNALSISGIVLDAWEASCKVLVKAAKNNRIALTVPVLVRANSRIHNSFFFISETGECLGEYRKRFPTPQELAAGVVPDKTDLIIWNGLKIGGAICFDSMFGQTFTEQAAQGARLFLMPSLWPGGSQLNHWCRELGVTCALAYPAWSRIVDIDGREKVCGGYRNETLRFGFGSPVYCADINFDRECFFANENQDKIIDIEKCYGDKIRIDFDQENCCFYIESVSSKIKIADIKRTFNLISKQDYLNNCHNLIRNF
jgi:hypothetical protein